MKSILLAIIAVLLCVACPGFFTVSGTVVDQHGEPISGVSLSTSAAVVTDYEVDSYGGESSLKLSDETFKVRCGGCSAVHLFFSKEGFHPQSVDLAFYERSSGLKVVLQKIENPISLRQYTAEIGVGPDAEETAMVFTGDKPYFRTITDILADRRIPSLAYVSVRPAVEENGAWVAKSPGEPPLSSHAFLDFSTARGGLQMYETPTISIERAYTEMVVAPVDGYQESILIEPGYATLFFYCIVDGRYCKGRIMGPSISNRGGKQRLSVIVVLFLSPYVGNRSLDDPRGYTR